MLYKAQLPGTWKQLQDDVSGFFEELGFTSNTPYMCTNEAISFEIDVFAEKSLNGIPIKILIECKHWESFVPQDVIFSMITRVSRFGANTGIIISKKGFQKGAISTVESTNILLYTYQEFIEHFQNEWIDVQLNLIFTKLSLFNSVEWDCFLDAEEAKKENSDFIKNYGYLLLIHANMRSGYCNNHKNYSDERFFNLIPAEVFFPNGEVHSVDVLGDAFRLFIRTDFLKQIDGICRSVFQ